MKAWLNHWFTKLLKVPWAWSCDDTVDFQCLTKVFSEIFWLVLLWSACFTAPPLPTLTCFGRRGLALHHLQVVQPLTGC